MAPSTEEIPAMPDPNNALAAWQLAVIALVAVGTLAGWLVAVFLAARPSGRADRAAVSLPGESAAAGIEQAAVVAEPGPPQQAGRREAA
jgi:hypothetical protein